LEKLIGGERLVERNGGALGERQPSGPVRGGLFLPRHARRHWRLRGQGRGIDAAGYKSVPRIAADEEVVIRNLTATALHRQ